MTCDFDNNAVMTVCARRLRDTLRVSPRVLQEVFETAFLGVTGLPYPAAARVSNTKWFYLIMAAAEASRSRRVLRNATIFREPLPLPDGGIIVTFAPDELLDYEELKRVAGPSFRQLAFRKADG